MEDYFLAKRRLFTGERAERAVDQHRRPLRRQARGRVRRRSPSPRRATSAPTCARSTSASTPPGSRFRLRRARTPSSTPRCRCRAASTSRTRSARSASSSPSAIELADAVAALADAERVPGRFEPVDEGQPFAVLVDYAHTPDSLENVLVSARQITPDGTADLRLRLRRRSRPRQAPADGRDRGGASPTSPSSPRTTRARRIPPRSSPRSARGCRPRGAEIEVEVDRRGGDRPRARPRARRRRHRRHRRQGSRAGPGVRARPQDPVRRPRGRREKLRALAPAPGARSVIELAPRTDRRRGAGRRGRRGGRRRAARARPRSTRARPTPGDLFFGLTAGRDRRRRARRRRDRGRRVGGRGRAAPRHRARRPPADAGAAWIFAADDPLAALQALARAWRRELGCRVVGDHRLDRQDLGQGHHPGAAAGARARQPGELQHRDRPAADDPLRRRPRPRPGAARWRCAASARSPSCVRSPSPTSARSPTSGPCISSCSARSRRSPRRRRRSCSGLGPAGAP